MTIAIVDKIENPTPISSGRHQCGGRGVLRFGRGVAVERERVGRGAGADVAGDPRPNRRIQRYGLDYEVEYPYLHHCTGQHSTLIPIFC